MGIRSPMDGYSGVNQFNFKFEPVAWIGAIVAAADAVITGVPNLPNVVRLILTILVTAGGVLLARQQVYPAAKVEGTGPNEPILPPNDTTGL